MPFLTFVNNLFAQGESVNTNTFAANQALLTAFLQSNQNATIRVYVAATSGFGHQANTVNLIWSLTAAGFNQAVQLIYDDTIVTQPTTLEKLATLIPGLNPLNPIPVTINGVTISFIAQSVFTANAQPVRTFGITGGYDSSGDNLATLTNTKLFLKLQPYAWPQANALYIRDVNEQSTVIVDLSDVTALGEFVYTRLNYYLPLPQMGVTDYTNFTNSDPTKVAPYRAILAACAGDNPAANMMPVYGIGDKLGIIESLAGARPESILYNLIAAIAYTQDHSDVPKLKKGAIIVVIASVTATPYGNLTAMLNGTNAAAPALSEYSTSQKLDERVKIISFDDVNFDARMAEVTGNPDKILVIKMNGLPSAPFNYIYYKSTLPCVFEGKGTASLVLNLPVPYINLTSSRINRKYVYPTLPLPNVKLLQPEVAANAQAVYCNNDVAYRMTEAFSVTNTTLSTRGFDDTVIKAAGQFIWKVYEPEQPVAAYLATLPVFFHNQQNDKLLKAMFYMLQCVKEL